MTSRQPGEGQRLPRRAALGVLGASALAVGGAALATTGTAPGTPRLTDVLEHGATGDADRGGPAGPVPPSLLPGGEFDQFVRSQTGQDQFSGNVLLAYRGHPVLTASYGMADKALSVPNTPGTLFALASVAKSLTAAAVLQLAQQGKLSFWETLGSYLGGFPAQVASKVTVHQLLTMTSGMGDYYVGTAWQQDINTWSTAAEVLDGTMGFIREQALQFAPGTQYYYSDSGFVVLGAIVQQVSGQSYWDYMRENIFALAGMSRTAFYTKPELLGLDARREVAHPYSSQRTGSTRVDVFGNFGFIGLPDGAGGPYTTAADMLRFATGLRDGTLLNPAYADMMLNGKFPLTPPTDVSPRQRVWMSGYGLEDTIVGNQHVLCHSGDGPGIATLIDIYPDLDWTVVILENYDLVPFGTTMEDSSVASLERQLITQQAQ